MSVIDHMSLGVPDVKEAEKFYTPLLSNLKIQRLAQTDAFVAYGSDFVQFLIMQPEDGRPATSGNGTHVCFRANSKSEVSAFHAFAVDSGGSSAGQPGPREAYPLPDVYTAFVRDPYGNKLEAICNGFAGSVNDE